MDNEEKLQKILSDMRDLIFQIEQSGYKDVTIRFDREDSIEGEGFPVKFNFHIEDFEGRDNRCIKKIFEVLYDQFREDD